MSAAKTRGRRRRFDRGDYIETAAVACAMKRVALQLREAVTLSTNWRLWASLPLSVVALTTIDAAGVIGAVPRPMFPRGVCRSCGCTEIDACLNAFGEGCAWANREETLCTCCVTPGPRPVRRYLRRRR